MKNHHVLLIATLATLGLSACDKGGSPEEGTAPAESTMSSTFESAADDAINIIEDTVDEASDGVDKMMDDAEEDLSDAMGKMDK